MISASLMIWTKTFPVTSTLIFPADFIVPLMIHFVVKSVLTAPIGIISYHLFICTYLTVFHFNCFAYNLRKNSINCTLLFIGVFLGNKLTCSNALITVMTKFQYVKRFMPTNSLNCILENALVFGKVTQIS